jgi:hypothetical protein
LLEGEDALCEFLSWRDAYYVVEKLASEFESTIKRNLNLPLQGPTTFVAQSAFLSESNVGLNSDIIASKKFGSVEWQDAIRRQSLEREDFVVLGWLRDGRTMRQAAREFGFDIIKATGILYRLLLTESVEVLRSGAGGVAEQVSDAQAHLPQSKHGEEVKATEKAVLDHLANRGVVPEPQETSAQKEQSTSGVVSDKSVTEPVNSPPAQNSGFATIAGDAGMGGAIGSALSSLKAVVESVPYAMESKPGSEKNREKQSTTAELSKPAVKALTGTIDCAPDVAAPATTLGEQEEESSFSARRTEALPLVTIDIERLLQATFTLTTFGKLALTNEALDQHLRQTLVDVEGGKTLQLVINSSVRTPASVLSTYRFCLARGYVISPDPVIPLTADLLLGRIELDQYLLQRRRINGDELRDLMEIQRQKGSKLADLLVRSGYLTVGDFARLTSEQKRFALK